MLSLWSAECVELVREHLTAVSNDDRPWSSIGIARLLARGEVRVRVVRKAAVAAHACAREIIATASDELAAIAVARAAGNALATVHGTELSVGGANHVYNPFSRSADANTMIAVGN